MSNKHRCPGSALTVIVVAIAALLYASGVARADTGPTPNADHPARPAQERPVRLGALAGVGFPRPFAVEAVASIASVVDVGVEYGFLPTLEISSVHTDTWSVAGDLRIHPFRNEFFVGLLVGRQHIGATTTLSVAGYGSATEQLGLDSWYLNPRMGFLWTTRYGLAIGFDAGLQVPLSSSVTSNLPLSLYPSAQARADALGAAIVPTLDLLRIGLML
jgi:hypothetical protein